MPDGLPTALPPDLDVEGARLPASYQAARRALAVCVRIDECRDWAIKAEALASYARQMNDTAMRDMAVRIQGRAYDRAGELLREIPPGRGLNQNIDDAADTKVPTRKDAARDAGLSDRQRVTALRINNVPRDEFERVIEGPNPPTVTELAERGKQTRTAHLGGRDPEDFYEATQLCGLLSHFNRTAPDLSVDVAKRGLWPDELVRVINDITTVRQWLDRAAAILEASDNGI